MAVVVIQEFEATPEQYGQVTENIDPGSNPPRWSGLTRPARRSTSSRRAVVRP